MCVKCVCLISPMINFIHLHFAHILNSLMHIFDTRILISMQSLRVLQVVYRHTQRHVAEMLAPLMSFVVIGIRTGAINLHA